MRQTEYMYSFREYVQLIIDETHIDNWQATGSLADILNESLTILGLSCNNLPFITATNPDIVLNVRVEELFNLIKARYFDHGFFVSETELPLSRDDLTEEYQKLLRKPLNNLLNKIALTYKKYDLLLGYYASKEATLLDQVSSTSTGANSNININKRNETPQNEGDYSGDTHTTEVSRAEGTADNTIVSVTDKDTPIMRLAEIHQLYKELLSDWSNEMERCFFEEEIV